MVLRIRFFFLFVFSFAATSPAAADKIAYPAQKISARGISEIKILGVKGHLKIRGGPSPFYRIKISHSKGKRFDDWSLSADRQGNALVLEVFNVAVGAQWRRFVREDQWPEFDIELEGPAQPAVISWREGDVQILNWDGDADVTFLKGIFRAESTRGSLKLQAVETDVHILDHTGPLLVHGQRGQVELARIRGALDLNWLDGTLWARDLEGTAALNLVRGRADLRELRGRLKVRGESSGWDIGTAAVRELEVTTESGPVRLRGGVRKTFLTSTSGKILVPKKWQIEDRDGVKVVENLAAAPAQGSVFVRTQSGAITWR